jgi:hypothetical protein
MDGLEPTRADDLRNAVRVIPVRLDRHRVQRRYDMPALQANDGEALVNKMPADPFRRRTGIETDASKTISPSVNSTPHGLGVTEHLPLPWHLTSLANDANGYRVERGIQSCIDAHADLLLPGRLRASGERLLSERGRAFSEQNRKPHLFRISLPFHQTVLRSRAGL